MNSATALQKSSGKSASAGKTAHSGLLLQRRCACGAPASQSLTGECEPCKAKRLQRKLRIGASNDPLEHEADRVADQVMAAPASTSMRDTGPRIRRFSVHSSGETSAVPPSVDRVLAGAGRPLEPTLQGDMSRRFGHDFSRVRIHTGAAAEQSARDVEAAAYTVGKSIVFGAGRFAPATPAGRRLLAHELTHVVQQDAAYTGSVLHRQPQPDPNTICYDPAGQHPVPDAAHPEQHATYERWLASFQGMVTSPARDTVQGGAPSGFAVLGHRGARYGAQSTSATEPVPVAGRARSGEEFIDHSTNEWVNNCLPANLRATAYELPSDCADIAVILRHVWLAAHHRTERYHGWTVGDHAGHANQARARRLIHDVGSWNVAGMVNAYSDQSGRPLRDFSQLKSLLHPGDILVWEHREIIRHRNGRITTRRKGGHTQTIFNIIQQPNGTPFIQVLQGNQPIFSDAATAIMSARGIRHPNPESAEGLRLRHLPGRRIESSGAISTGNFKDPITHREVWGQYDNGAHTLYSELVAAGPPRAAVRPHARNRHGISDWRSAVRRARRATFAGVLESILQEARSTIEQTASSTTQTTLPQAVTAPEMQTLGRQMGEHLHALYRRAVAGLSQTVSTSTEVIDTLAADAHNKAVAPVFHAFEQAFIEAALPGATAEERRLYTESTSTNRLLRPFAAQISSFGPALERTRSLQQLEAVARTHGQDLWHAATARAQAASGGQADDRPLYFSRLQMIQELRQFHARFHLSAADREQMVTVFERASRGMDSATFGAVPATLRILVSGFDPFGSQGVSYGNPSGAVALALDGTSITGGAVTAEVQSAVFPVRFSDFNAGIVERFFGPYVTGPNPVTLILMLGMQRAGYELEEYAARTRTTQADAVDNLGQRGGTGTAGRTVPPGVGPGPQFIRSTLPSTTRLGLGRTSPTAGETTVTEVPAGQSAPVVRPGGPTPGSTAIQGTGGSYFCNEIFYRTALLGRGTTVRIGFMHVPSLPKPGAGPVEDQKAEIIKQVRQVLQAALLQYPPASGDYPQRTRPRTSEYA